MHGLNLHYKLKFLLSSLAHTLTLVAVVHWRMTEHWPTHEPSSCWVKPGGHSTTHSYPPIRLRHCCPTWQRCLPVMHSSSSTPNITNQ